MHRNQTFYSIPLWELVYTTFRNSALKITEVSFLDANSYSYYNSHASLTLKKSLHDLMNSVRCFVSILLLDVFCKNVWNACTQWGFKCRVSLYQIVKVLHAVIVGCESVGIYSVITCKMCDSEPHWALLMLCSSMSSEINKQAGSLHAWKHHKWFCYFLSDDGDYFYEIANKLKRKYVWMTCSICKIRYTCISMHVYCSRAGPQE